MKRSSLTLVISVAALAVTLLAACEEEHSIAPPLGVNCTIQFRRDALGAATQTPVPPTTVSYNGAQTSMGGKIKLANKEWLVIESGLNEVWIPRAAILLIQFDSK